MMMLNFWENVLAVEDHFRQHGGESLEGLVAAFRVHWVAVLILTAVAFGLGILLGGLP